MDLKNRKYERNDGLKRWRKGIYFLTLFIAFPLEYWLNFFFLIFTEFNSLSLSRYHFSVFRFLSFTFSFFISLLPFIFCFIIIFYGIFPFLIIKFICVSFFSLLLLFFFLFFHCFPLLLFFFYLLLLLLWNHYSLFSLPRHRTMPLSFYQIFLFCIFKDCFFTTVRKWQPYM